MMLLDKDIREPLFEFLEERYGKVRILEEKTVGHSRADVVMVIPEKIVGIEIKSDADTYTRLERQVADYDLYIVREMQDNPYAQLLRTIRVLWRPELARIQEKYGLPMYKQKSKDFVRTIIVDRLPVEVVHKEISDALFERDYTAMLAEIQEFSKAQAAKRGKTVRKKRKKYRRKKRDA